MTFTFRGINRDSLFNIKRVTRCIFCGGDNIIWGDAPRRGNWDCNPHKWVFFDFQCQDCSCVMREVWELRGTGALQSPSSCSWDISQERMRMYDGVNYLEYSFWGVVAKDIPPRRKNEIPWGKRSMPCLFCGIPLLSWNHSGSIRDFRTNIAFVPGPIRDFRTCVAFLYLCPHCRATMAKLWRAEKMEYLFDLPRFKWRITRRGELRICLQDYGIIKIYSLWGMRVIPSPKGRKNDSKR